MRESSTAAFIAYNLRPSKQTERRLLLDFLKGGVRNVVGNCVGALSG
jgi:hypothetical protein